MEIERKFFINDFPDIEYYKKAYIFQSYIYTGDLECRIRERINIDVETDKVINKNYKLCFKTSGDLSREEIELEISKDKYDELLKLVNGKPIQKIYHAYYIDDMTVEISFVDNTFFYCEIEFDDEEYAREFKPFNWLSEEVTYDNNYKMKNYWKRTR